MKRSHPFLQYNNRYKKTSIISFFILLLWIFCPSYSTATSTWTPDSIQATVGYGNYINPGRYTPITITIKNGYAASGGTVELTVPTNTDDYYTYQKSYPSSPGSVRVTFCVPSSNFNDRISVLVDNHQDPPQQISLNYSFPLPEEDTPIFFGVLSNNSIDFNYLNQLNLTNYYLQGYSYSLSQEEIASDFHLLDNFDCIIIDDFSLSSLYEAQLESLRDWVYHGGIILIGNHTEHLDRLLPSSYSDTTYTTLNELTKLNMDADLSKYSYGSGHFIISSFSLSSIGSLFMNNQVLQDDFAEAVFGQSMLENLQTPYFSTLNSLQSEASTLTSQVQATTDVNLFLYGFILIVYLLILLPFIYYQLKKRDLVQYFRFALPLLSIAIACIIFLFGSKTRFSHPFLTYVSIQEYDNDQVKESIFTGIQAPYNKAYSVSIDNSYELIPLQTSSLSPQSITTLPSSSNHEIMINYRENDYLLTFENLVAFNMRNFQLEKTSALTGKQFVSGNVLYYNNTVSGVISNQLGIDLDSAMLALPGYFVRIGDFPNEASVILETCDTQMNTSSKYQPSDPDILSPIVFSSSTSSRSSNDTKLNLLNYYLKQCDIANENKAYLIGFSNATPDFQSDTNYTINGLTLVCVPVSLATNHLNQHYYMSLPAQMNQISGDFSEDGEEIYSHFATVRYDIFQEYIIDELSLFFLELIGSKSYSFVSKFYFWRKDKYEYEQVYPGQSHFTKEDLKNYITSENSLLVQYYTEENAARLPRITAIGGKNNANH